MQEIQSANFLPTAHCVSCFRFFLTCAQQVIRKGVMFFRVDGSIKINPENTCQQSQRKREGKKQNYGADNDFYQRQTGQNPQSEPEDCIVAHLYCS